MEYEIKVKEDTYKVDAEIISNEIMEPVADMFNHFLEMQEQYEAMETEFKMRKHQLLQMCEKLNQTIGFKSLKNEYGTITYVPAKEEGIELVEDYDVVNMLSDLAKHGEDISKYIIKVEQKTKSRKAYVKTK